jgi:hypothetical protein
MPSHDVFLSIRRPIELGRVDIEVEVRSDRELLGRVRISKGAIDWMPSYKSKTAYSMAWERFADFMEGNGRQVSRA